MPNQGPLVARRGFYFFFSHNESPYVHEDYTFEAEITVADTGDTQAFSSTGHPFWYRPLPRKGQQPRNNNFRPLKHGILKSADLPAIVIFAANVPANAEVTAAVSGFDQYQRGYPAEVNQFCGRIIKWWTDQHVTKAPLLPPTPRLFLQPLTYEVLTSEETSFPARYRLLVEDWSGWTPKVYVNGQAISLGEPIRVTALPEPLRWEVPRGVARLTVNHPEVSVHCVNRCGCNAYAGYRFRPMDRYEEEGLELDGPQSVHYSDYPGGRTPIAAYAGIVAEIQDVPVISNSMSPPSLCGSPTDMVVSVGGTEYSVPVAVQISDEPSAIQVRFNDPYYGLTEETLYCWEPMWRSHPFVLVRYHKRLSKVADTRLIFAASPDESVLVSLHNPHVSQSDHSALLVLGVGAAVRAGEEVKIVSGSPKALPVGP